MERKVNLKDVARDADVSLSTASHALNGTAPLTIEVRERVLDSAKRLGYLDRRRTTRRLPLCVCCFSPFRAMLLRRATSTW